MSVLCCHLSHFLYGLAARRYPTLSGGPVALLGPDETVWAVSPLAAHSGVQPSMSPRLAQVRCPDLLLHPLDLDFCQTEQRNFLEVLTALDLPVEEITWGQAYLDLHTVATQKAAVQAVASDLGRQLCRRLGGELQPAIGWDSGKFTAQAAAVQTRPGHMRLVDRADETTFLAPLPLTLLPLPPAALQQLHWLGMRTLGQFAALPAAAVWQRFGRAGKLAQAWARGQDKRPVQPTVAARAGTIAVDFDPPAAALPMVMAAIAHKVEPAFKTLAANLQGCCGVHLTLTFLDRTVRAIDLRLVEPVTRMADLTLRLQGPLAALNWPDALSNLTLALAVSDLPVQQLTLLPEATAPSAGLEGVARRLAARYGSIFFEGAVVEEEHPVAERRITLAALI